MKGSFCFLFENYLENQTIIPIKYHIKKISYQKPIYYKNLYFTIHYSFILLFLLEKVYIYTQK